MDIFRKKFLKSNIPDTKGPNEFQESNDNGTLEEEPQQSESQTRTSVNLMNKLFQSQNSFQADPPEFLFENEAWSPDQQFVRLFHKGNRFFEDQDKTISHE